MTQQIRLTISNLFGSSPLRIERICVALADGRGKLAAGSAAIVIPTLHHVTCNGSTRFHLLPRSSCVTDPIAIQFGRGDHLSISIFLSDGQEHLINGHYVGHTTTWLHHGNVTTRYDVSDGEESIHWFWITRVEGLVPLDCVTITCFGDSITDTLLGLNTYVGWPDRLTREFDARDSPLSVLNLGISGDRLLTGGIARFARDALHPHGKRGYLMLHIGVNDLGFTAVDPASQSDLYHRLIAGYQQVAHLAHQHGIFVIGSTIMPLLSPPGWPTPWEFSDERRDVTRQKVNQWILSSGTFDKVIDFSAAVADPEHPNRMRPMYHNGDYLHPSREGYRAMSRAIDLEIFTPTRSP